MPNLIAALVCAVLGCMPAIADAHAVVTTESRISEIALVDVPILLAAALYGRGLFEGKPAEVAATSEPNQAPSIEPGKLYSLKLLPRAVFLRMPVKEAGSYRVTFSEAATADVLVSSKKATPTATRSFPECKLFQKSVEVVLPASDSVVVQLSGTQASSKSVKLAVVPAHRSYSK
jgi:hypothetical protein